MMYQSQKSTKTLTSEIEDRVRKLNKCSVVDKGAESIRFGSYSFDRTSVNPLGKFRFSWL